VTLLPAVVEPDPPDRRDRHSTRPRWSAFRYTSPDARRSALRASIWRELQRLGALKLQPCVWAVPHQDPDATQLADLAARVRAEGGRADVVEVDHVERCDVELQSRLDRSCERLWDDLLNAADWFERQVDHGALAPTEHAEAYDELRALYGSALGRDLVRSGASRLAAERLHRLGAGVPEVNELSDVSWAPDLVGAPRRAPVRHRVHVEARWLQRDGDTMLTARLHPLPSRSWEAAFRAFESWAYRPSPTRAPLELGMVSGPVPTGDFEGAVDRLTAREACFESSIDRR
jgi:hypothetical protein